MIQKLWLIKLFKVVADCMDTVYTGEDAWDANDYTPSERMDFVEQLSSKQYKQVEKFFATMPKLSHTIEVINPNTKKRVVSFWRDYFFFFFFFRFFSGKYCKRGS